MTIRCHVGVAFSLELMTSLLLPDFIRLNQVVNTTL
jgi:hypothetical protein